LPTKTSRVLIVDDDADTLVTYARILTAAGYEIATANGCRAGLALLETESFRLLLTDVRMPDGSGLEVLAEARHRRPLLPVVVYSAWGTPALETAARQLGAAEFHGELLDIDSILVLTHKYVDVPDPVGLTDTAAKDALGPATRRWMSIVLAVTASETDIPTIKEWSNEIQHSVTTLKRYCSACGVTASDSLDFARALRVVRSYSGRPVNWYNALDIADPITLNSFLSRAGLSNSPALPRVSTFISNQHFVTDVGLLKAISSAVNG
jgi:ActR/RegA family two-component response regulator